jgi:hypothetical protein
MSERSVGKAARVAWCVVPSLVAFIALSAAGCGSGSNGGPTVFERGVRIGVPILDKKDGTAQLPVTTPGAGTIIVAGGGVVHKEFPARVAAKAPPYAGTFPVEIEAKGFRKATLLHTGKVEVAPTIIFRPTGGHYVSGLGTGYHLKLKKD